MADRVFTSTAPEGSLKRYLHALASALKREEQSNTNSAEGSVSDNSDNKRICVSKNSIQLTKRQGEPLSLSISSSYPVVIRRDAEAPYQVTIKINNQQVIIKSEDNQPQQVFIKVV